MRVCAGDLLVLPFCFLISGMASAQDPEIASAVASVAEIKPRFLYEGLVRGSTGQPLEGIHDLAFAVFRGGSAGEPDSGTLLYGETASVSLTGGQATHAVGTGTPTFGTLEASLLSGAGQTASPDDALWLQVSVGDGMKPLLPRTRLAAAPYAAFAGDAQSLGGLPSSAYLRTADLEKASKALVRLAGTGYNSFIGGGINNDASGHHTTIGAGYGNVAQGFGDSILGGFYNWATRTYSSIGGGYQNRAIGDYSTVAGGDRNEASALNATAGGGSLNAAQGPGTTIAGGVYNWATRLYSTIGGGFQNQATGNYATVPGGLHNSASGDYSFAAGRRSKATAPGTFVWSDSQDSDWEATLADSISLRAQNGARLHTNSSNPGLRVNNDGSGRAATFASTSAMTVTATGASPRATGRFTNTGTGVGVDAITAAGTTGAGVWSESTGPSGIGVLTLASNGSNARALWAVSSSGYAGWFTGKTHVAGNLSVSGTLSKGGGSFKIDHPLDPEKKYLYHSFIESPDMKNVYDGTVVLGEKGEATIELPDYFEALNRDFRYQLTPIGAQASLYVAEEIRENRFRIAGGRAGLKVSWQVTGIRKDPFAEANRIPVEETKPESEQGTYLHPEAYGQLRSKSATAAMDQVPSKPGDSGETDIQRQTGRDAR